MAKTLQFRRGTTSELSSQTGAVGELFVDTTKDTVVVMDGSTAGGFPLVKESSLSAYATTNTVNQGLATKQDTLLSGTNIKTVNGTSLLGSGNITISGSGSSFDQDLNTTDAVVFDSALIGDVSIVSNTISGTDAYGNADTLVVGSNLNVQFGEQSTTTQTINASTFGNSMTGFAIMAPGNKFFITSGGPGYGPTSDVSAFISGASITMPVPGYGTYTLVLTSDMAWDGSMWIADCQLTSGGPIGMTVALFGYQGSITVTTLIDTQVTPLEVTESGVNVEGTFTVNGQPVGGSGSSFDQDLNTTDDVLFNSALIGDVSIVGNTISGTDAYGNASELLITAPLTVSTGEISTNTITYNDRFTNPQRANNLSWQAGGSTVSLGVLLENFKQLFKALNPGDTFTLRNNNTNQLITFTVVSINDNGDYLNLNVEQFNSGDNIFFSEYYFELNYNVDTLVNVLGVTESGVNVEGTFTVNGQPVGGSGSSYDQDLNTTDDVLFNSALIGEVSIIGNTITAIDSYGGTNDYLIIDNKIITPALDVRVYEDNQQSYEAVQSFGQYPYLYNYPWQRSIQIYNYGGGENNAVMSALDAATTSKATVNFSVNTMFGTSVGYFKIDYRMGGAGFSSGSYYFSEFVVTSGYNFFFTGVSLYGATFTIGDVVELLPLSVTETGVAVEGTLTVNGSPISTASFDQDLNTTDDVVFNSALIGEVSIIGNEIGAIDAYGNSDTLVVNGDLDVTKTITRQEEVVTQFIVGQDFSNSNYIARQTPGSGAYIHFYNTSRNFIDTMVAGIGQQFELTGNIAGTDYSGTFTIQTASDQGNAVPVYISAVTGNLNQLFDGSGGSYSPQLGLTVSKPETVTIVDTFNPLSVTETIVNVQGELIVDGEIIQEVQEQIAPTWTTAGFYFFSNIKQISLPPEATSQEVLFLDSLTSGQRINFTITYQGNTNSGYGIVDYVRNDGGNQRTIMLFSYGGWTNGNYENIYSQSLITVDSVVLSKDFVTTIIPTTPLTVTAAGVNVEGTLTVNGSPVNVTSYDQDLNTTDDVVFNSALIGDVSIVGNTITATDSYGNAGELIVDGDLTVTGELSSPTSLTITVGGSIISTTINNYTGVDSITWTGTTFSFPSDIDSTLIDFLSGLPIGTHIKFTRNVYGSFDIVKTTNGLTGSGGRWNVDVTDSNLFGFNMISDISVNEITIEETIPTSTYGFGTDGTLTLPESSEPLLPPPSPTLVKWVKVSIADQIYYMPLYQ
jgi:hypothetical protein